MSLGFPGIGGSGNPGTTSSLTIGTVNTTPITSFRFGTTAALSSGTLIVADTGATANSRYFFTTHTLGTVTLPQAYYASARSAGVSFTITSGNVTDTSTVDWHAIN